MDDLERWCLDFMDREHERPVFALDALADDPPALIERLARERVLILLGEPDPEPPKRARRREPLDIPVAAAELVERTRTTQGLPATVEDPAVLDRVAAIIRSAS